MNEGSWKFDIATADGEEMHFTGLAILDYVIYGTFQGYTIGSGYGIDLYLFKAVMETGTISDMRAYKTQLQSAGL